MLGLDQFSWVFKAAAGAAKPAMSGRRPKPTDFIAPGTNPPYFKPPKMPKVKKPKVGAKPAAKAQGRAMPQHTISQWKTGPHIKLEDGWFPYDPDKQKYQTDDGKWINVK